MDAQNMPMVLCVVVKVGLVSSDIGEGLKIHLGTGMFVEVGIGRHRKSETAA